MRELTFKGFLKKYLSELSLYHSTSVYALLSEAENDNCRIYEPLLFYVVLTLSKQRLDTFLRKSKKLYDDYYNYFDIGAFDEAEFNFENLPQDYLKVYNSYIAYKNKNLNESNLKKLMRNKILQLRSAKQISDYRIYSDLKINPGNYNSFVKHEMLNKISLENTRLLLQYLEAV